MSPGLIKLRTYFSISWICEFLFSSNSTYFGTISDYTVSSFLNFFCCGPAFSSSTFKVEPYFLVSFFAEVCSTFLSLGVYYCFAYYFVATFYFFFFYFLSYFVSVYPVAYFSYFSFFFNACFYFQASVFFFSP